ncbi:MAG: hypothetical protein EPN93_13625 [Spirochaetes bacterium]|nr:MAG: hypothetical protein EPN93_13625 [Spirochaetota bacterium]
MVIDCHFHWDELITTPDDLIRTMNESGVDKISLMASMNQPVPLPHPAVSWLMRSFLERPGFREIPRMLLSNFSENGDIKLPGGEYEIFRDPDNDVVFKLVDQYPGKFLGWVFVNPRGEKIPTEELARFSSNKNLAGGKAHPFWHRYSPIKLQPVAAELVKLRKPLLIHCDFSPFEQYRELSRLFPELKIILAHAAFPCYSETWKRIKDIQNMFVDISQISYVSGRMTRRVIEFLGADRCLFGTDGPTGTHEKGVPINYGYTIRRFESLFTDPGIRRRVLGENFAEMVGIQENGRS